MIVIIHSDYIVKDTHAKRREEKKRLMTLFGHRIKDIRIQSVIKRSKTDRHKYVVDLGQKLANFDIFKRSLVPYDKIRTLVERN